MNRYPRNGTPMFVCLHEVHILSISVRACMCVFDCVSVRVRVCVRVARGFKKGPGVLKGSLQVPG